jgi:hypothetical protein
MSINPVIWRKASRLSSPRLLRRVLRRYEKALLIGPALAVFLLMGSQVPWASAYRGFGERRAERASLAPLLAEALRERLTFPQVVVAHPAHLGRVVYWEVTVQSSTSSYAEGRVNRPILWTNPERVARELQWYETPVLARVAAVREDAVYLDYLGRP